MPAMSGAKALHFVVGVIPATLTVIFAGLISLVALVLDTSRRDYALALADRFVDLAAVLAGAPPRGQSTPPKLP